MDVFCFWSIHILAKFGGIFYTWLNPTIVAVMVNDFCIRGIFSTVRWILLLSYCSFLSFLHIYYTTFLTICQYLFANLFLWFRRMTSKSLCGGRGLSPSRLLLDCQSHPVRSVDFSLGGVGEFVARALGINHFVFLQSVLGDWPIGFVVGFPFAPQTDTVEENF